MPLIISFALVTAAVPGNVCDISVSEELNRD